MTIKMAFGALDGSTVALDVISNFDHCIQSWTSLDVVPNSGKNLQLYATKSSKSFNSIQ